MHISLDSALGRQRRLNSVGESVLQIAPDAAAAYSLRSLTGGDPDVVRVRRESDNTEKDFSGSQIESGEMARWVNEQPTLPLDLRELDTNTGERDGALIEAAAAYSLRNLSSSYTGDVVEVRRSSDDAEESFTAAEVADGTLTDWVNADVDKLDLQPETGGLVGNVSNETATGFDFSVNNEGSTGFKNLLHSSDLTAGTYIATFDVVLNSGSLAGVSFRSISPDEETTLVAGSNSITVNPDGTLNIYFKTLGTAVADVSITNITLTQTTADGHVKTWYDQSSNTNDATQTDPTNQPKIVEGGNLLKDSNNKPEIDFDGTDDYFDLTSNIGFQGGGGCVISLQDPQSGVSTATLGSSSSNRLISFPDASARWYFTTNAIDVDSSTTVSGLTLFTINHDGTTNDPNVKAFRDGSLMVATTPDAHQGEANTSTVANQIGARRDLTYLSGVLKELIIYTTDQSDNRTAIEANIGETYGITAIPAANDTVNGYVQTWYDQSGSGNDAVQTTAANQPKIVDAGTLVTGGIDFDGSQHFETIGSGVLTNIQDTFIAFVGTRRNSSTNLFAMASTFPDRLYIKPNVINIGDPSASATIGLIDDIQALGTIQGSAGNYTVFRDGTETGTATTDETGAGSFTLGSNDTYTSSVDGKLAEFIIYETDQSSNRPAIEANINNQYDIY